MSDMSEDLLVGNIQKVEEESRELRGKIHTLLAREVHTNSQFFKDNTHLKKVDKKLGDVESGTGDLLQTLGKKPVQPVATASASFGFGGGDSASEEDEQTALEQAALPA